MLGQVRLDQPLGRTHLVTIDFVAAPVPTPIPRAQHPEVETADPEDEQPSFRAGSPRGPVILVPTETDPDPPPF
jgi:hypothetical protein